MSDSFDVTVIGAGHAGLNAIKEIRSGEHEVRVDKLFLALGRRPSLERLNLDRLGVPLGPHGVPAHDPETLRVGRTPVYLAGDAAGGIERALDMPFYHPVIEEALQDALIELRQALSRRQPRRARLRPKPAQCHPAAEPGAAAQARLIVHS